uniref:DUF6598 domain-containing protein n=1 Tax=Chenopodium quinoa TaxID=63459 RepID=A0A803KRM4_CHEQI
MPNAYGSPPVDTIKVPKSPAYEYSCKDLKGTPLFELLSLRVGYHNFKDLRLEIYGRIELIDENQNKFSLFHRKKNEAKTVFLHNSSESGNPTTVILNNFDIQGPRCITKKSRLKFLLKDKRQNVTILDESKDVDCSQSVIYDQVQTVWYNTPVLWVSFDFLFLRCALIANVGIIVDKKDKSPESNIVPSEVHGSITSATVMSDLSRIQRLLFYGSKELVFGVLNNLASFAVPSYSFLEFEVNLEVNGDKITYSTKFEPDGWFHTPHEDEFFGKVYHIRLIVDWGLGKRFLLEYPSSELQYDNSKKDKLIYDHRHPLDWFVSDTPMAYMEIFSVSVCFYGVNGCEGLNGKIKACDEEEDFVLFDGALGYHNSHETVNLTGPRRCYCGDHFSIHVNLKDGEGREISRGCVGYDFSNAQIFYNMRMCSIIRGKHGFAALQYTIFADAIQTKLKFTLEPIMLCDNVNYGVYGRINTSYSSYKYSTHYQKKYYQSSLFRKDVEEAVNLGKIPLSKSVVAVPLNGNTSLVVSAKLHVLVDGKRIETLQYKQAFNPPSLKRTRPKTTGDSFKSKNFLFQAFVKWTSLNL